MYTITLNAEDFKLLSSLPKAIELCRNVQHNNGSVTFQFAKDKYSTLRDAIEIEVAENGMDAKEEWLTDYGKDLTGLYDKIFNQVNNN